MLVSDPYKHALKLTDGVQARREARLLLRPLEAPLWHRLEARRCPPTWAPPRRWTWAPARLLGLHERHYWCASGSRLLVLGGYIHAAHSARRHDVPPLWMLYAPSCETHASMPQCAPAAVSTGREQCTQTACQLMLVIEQRHDPDPLWMLHDTGRTGQSSSQDTARREVAAVKSGAASGALVDASQCVRLHDKVQLESSLLC